MDIKIGDRVLIRGDRNDFTDHLDGKILEVYAIPGDEKEYDLSLGDSIVATDDEGNNWYIYISNILEVDRD